MTEIAAVGVPLSRRLAGPKNPGLDAGTYVGVIKTADYWRPWIRQDAA